MVTNTFFLVLTFFFENLIASTPAITEPQSPSLTEQNQRLNYHVLKGNRWLVSRPAGGAEAAVVDVVAAAVAGHAVDGVGVQPAA